MSDLLNWQDVHHRSFLKTAISSQKNGSQAFKTDLYLSLNQTVIFALLVSVIKSGQAVILQVTSYNLEFFRKSLRVHATCLCNYNSCTLSELYRILAASSANKHLIYNPYNPFHFVKCFMYPSFPPDLLQSLFSSTSIYGEPSMVWKPGLKYEQFMIQQESC